MKIDVVENQISFKSGYPTFGTAGHLSIKPEVYDLVYLGFRPDVLKEGKRLNILA